MPRFSVKTMIYLTALVALYILMAREIFLTQPHFKMLFVYAVIISVVGFKFSKQFRAENP